MSVSAQQLATIAGKPINENMVSIEVGLDAYGERFGLVPLHRLAHYICQLAHESGAFHYDREVWGPTPAQARYDTRTDLGNTPEKDGDGERNSGRGPLQITGGANLREFTAWVRKNVDPNGPDFFEHPELINTDPWEGVGPIWYWATRKLNAYADDNDIEMITRRINGGMNGFPDRLHWYTRTALVLAGYAPDAVKSFQIDAQRAGLLPADEPGKPTQIDGIPGGKTRSALHMTLAKAQPVNKPAVEVKPAPVTEKVEQPVVVAPKGADKTLWTRLNAAWLALAVPFASFGSLPTEWKVALVVGVVLSIAFLIFKGEYIAQRIKSVVKAFGE
jgi:putative chitinase